MSLIAMTKPVIERFLNKITVSDTNFYKDTPCWEWNGCLNAKGYGQITWHGLHYQFHRFIYEYFQGEIDSDLVIHHKCYNRRCVNPLHLEQVTQRENTLDKNSSSLTAVNAQKTHCIHGHEFTSENTYIRPNGSRNCKICQRVRERKAEQRKLENSSRAMNEEDY